MNAFRRIVNAASGMHPSSRSVLSSGVKVALFAIAAKLFTVLREASLAYRYGTGVEIDAFNMAFTVSTWLPVLLVSIASTGLVPLLVASVRDPIEHRRMLAELNATAVLVAILLCAVALAIAPWASSMITGAKTSTTLELTHDMIRQMAPVAGLGVLAGYLAARLQAQQRYAYTLGEAFPPLGVALSALLPIQWNGGWTLTTGLLVGTAVQLVFLIRLLSRSDDTLGGFSLRFTSKQWPLIRGAVGTLAIGAAVLWITVPVEQAFAARLGTGAVASLNYANRLIGMGTSIATLVIARALLPFFAANAADGISSRRQAWSWTWVCAAAGVATVAASWFLIEPAVRLLLQRGSFNQNDTATVEILIKIGILQLPLFFASTAMVQWMAATGQYRSISIIAAITVMFKISLLYILVPRFGLSALMISTVGMYAVSLICQMYMTIRPEISSLFRTKAGKHNL